MRRDETREIRHYIYLPNGADKARPTVRRSKQSTHSVPHSVRGGPCDGNGMRTSVREKIGAQHVGAVHAIAVREKEARLRATIRVCEIEQIPCQFAVLDDRAITIRKV